MDKFDVDVSIVSRLPLSGADAEWLLNKFIIDFFFFSHVWGKVVPTPTG